MSEGWLFILFYGALFAFPAVFIWGMDYGVKKAADWAVADDKDWAAALIDAKARKDKATLFAS